FEAVFGVGLHIGNVHHRALKERAPVDRAAFRLDRDTLDVVGEFSGEAIGLGSIENPTLLPGNGPLVGFTQASGRLNERMEFCLQVESRATDDLEHIAGRRSLFPLLGELAFEFSDSLLRVERGFRRRSYGPRPT